VADRYFLSGQLGGYKSTITAIASACFRVALPLPGINLRHFVFAEARQGYLRYSTGCLLVFSFLLN
jgi:hypothetical protein